MDSLREAIADIINEKDEFYEFELTCENIEEILAVVYPQASELINSLVRGMIFK